MVSKFGYGALISLGITVFSTISTIIPVLINTDDLSKDNNLNHQIFLLSHSLHVNFAVDNYDNFEMVFSAYKKNITHTISGSDLNNNSTIENALFDSYLSVDGTLCNYILQSYKDDQTKSKINQTNIFFYLLVLLEGKENNIFPQLYCNKLNKPIEHIDPSWYPLREALLIKNDLNLKKVLNVKGTEDKEDYFCDSLNYSKLCSYGEISNILSFKKNNQSIIDIVNKNPHNDITNKSEKLNSFLDYFKWFILTTLVAGPIVFFAWIRNYYE